MTSREGWCNYTFTFFSSPLSPFPALYFCFLLAPDERPLREKNILDLLFSQAFDARLLTERTDCWILFIRVTSNTYSLPIIIVVLCIIIYSGLY